MEIPNEVQNKLKCSECDELFSCGPVYLLHETGVAICGRCNVQSKKEDSTENSDRTRNDPYEAAASYWRFLAHLQRGYPENQQFSLGQSPYETNCKLLYISPHGS